MPRILALALVAALLQGCAAPASPDRARAFVDIAVCALNPGKCN